MPAGDSVPSFNPAPAMQAADCGLPLQGTCRTGEHPCRKHALLANFKDRRQREPRQPALVKAQQEVSETPVWAGSIGSLESPPSKPPEMVHRQSQVLNAGSVSRSVPIPSAQPLPERPRALEVCAGSAGLSKALSAIGFDSVGVDWIRNRHRAKAPIVRIDLSTEEGQTEASEMMKDPRIRYVHLAPPCGTFTRARDKRVPRHLVEAGAPDPPAA